MPATFWPHALLQMLVFVVYMLLLEPLAVMPSVQMRVADLEQATGWGLPFLIWLVYVFLLIESITRLVQRWAAQLFPFQKSPFLLASIVMATPLLFVAFVGMECSLFFVAMGRYPVYTGAMFFQQGFISTLFSDLPWMLVIALGECLRHWLYAGSIHKWHYEHGLRLRPLEDLEA